MRQNFKGASLPREGMQRDFKGIWIPREVWLASDLSLMEKVLFVEIHSLDNERGCFATNAYFAQFFYTSGRQIARVIASLKKKGFISVAIENLSERTIHVTDKYAYANPQRMRTLRRETDSLAARFSIHKRRGV